MADDSNNKKNIKDNYLPNKLKSKNYWNQFAKLNFKLQAMNIDPKVEVILINESRSIYNEYFQSTQTGIIC